MHQKWVQLGGLGGSTHRDAVAAGGPVRAARRVEVALVHHGLAVWFAGI